MKVLVTGSTGFLGSHLCELLKKSGHEVYAQARNKKKFQQFKVEGHFIQGDLETEKSNQWIEKLPKDLDAVVHAAGIVHSFQEGSFYKINTEGTKKLVEDLKIKYPKLHFIFLSSLSAAGPSLKSPVDENTVEEPVSHYGRSKLLAEKIILNEAPKGWSLSIVRPPMIIGPRDEGVLDIFKMVKGGIALKAGMKIKTKMYSFICIFDVTKFIVKLIQKETAHRETYFISHNKLISFEDLVHGIKEARKQKLLWTLPIPLILLKSLARLLSYGNQLFSLNFRLTPDKVSELIPSEWTCSSEKALREFGFTVDWSLEKTIKITLDDYEARNWL